MTETQPAVESPWTQRLAVFDLETTGVDPREARIVTAFVGVLGASGELESSQSWIADPGIEIPAGAAAVHGVSTERARAEGRPAADVAREVIESIRSLQAQGIAVTAYNAAYDFTVLSHEARRHGLVDLGAAEPVIDPLVIDKHVDTYRRGKRTLTVACEVYGVTLDDAHDASADAIAAGRVAQAIARTYAEVRVPVASLHASQIEWHRQQAESFADYMRRVRDPAFQPDLGWPVRA